MKGREEMLNDVQMDYFIKNSSVGKKDFLINKLRNLENDIYQTTRSLNNLCKSKEEAELQILSLKDSDFNKIKENLIAIQQLPLVEDMEVSSEYNFIKVTTKKIICKASNGGLYDVGAFTVKFYTGDCKFVIDNVGRSYRRRSAWGRHSIHPHVSDSGVPCLGNASESIVMLNIQQEYAALFSIVINFLSQANLGDVAGRYVANWDLIDKDGNVIRQGLESVEEGIISYNDSDYTKDVMPIKCEDCDEYANPYDGVYFEETQSFFCCNTCKDYFVSRYKRKQEKELREKAAQERLEQERLEQEKLKLEKERLELEKQEADQTKIEAETDLFNAQTKVLESHLKQELYEQQMDTAKILSELTGMVTNRDIAHAPVLNARRPKRSEENVC